MLDLSERTPGEIREEAEEALRNGQYWRAMEAANEVQRLSPEEFDRLSEQQKWEAVRASTVGQKAAEGIAELHDELVRYRGDARLEEVWDAVPEGLRDRFKIAFLGTPDVDDKTFLSAYQRMRDQLGV